MKSDRKEFDLDKFLEETGENLRPVKTKKKTKELLFNILLLFISVIFILILVELALRFIFPVYIDVLFIGDEFTGYKHIPNKVGQFYGLEFLAVKIKVNSEGFRDVEHKLENPENKYRIAFLGDSFTDALQMDFEKIFHQLLSKELEKKYPGKFEVFNFGVGAFSTAQEYISYKHYAEKYNPNLVILMFFTNDPLDNCCNDSSKPCFYIEEGVVKQEPFTPRIHSKWKLFIGEYFKSIVFLREKYYKIKRADYLKEDIESDGIYDVDKVFLKNYTPKIEECWNISRYFLKKLKEDTKASNTNLKVFIIPHPASLYKEDEARLLEEDTLFDRSYFDFNKPYKLIERTLDEEGIDYTNLMEALKKQNERLYFLRDGHLNEKGHEVAFEEIIRELKEDGIIE